MTERRIAGLLLVLLVGQLLLLSLQAPSPGAGSNALESVVLRLVAPVASGVARTTGAVSGLGEGWRRQRRLVAENRALRSRVEKLELEAVRLSNVESDLRRLAAALDYHPAPAGELRVADVIYVDHASWLKTLLIHVGGAPAEPSQPVINAGGLVGRVVLVAPPYAKVQLITDRTAAVGAMIRRTRRQGVVRSGGEGLELDFVPLGTDVAVGDRVVTSGTDGIYPRGIPVGTVVAVEPGDELFQVIRLEPAVDFGVLDQVYLLSRPPLPAELTVEVPGALP